MKRAIRIPLCFRPCMALLIVWAAFHASKGYASGFPRSFTVADDIGTSQFGPTVVSPDGRLVFTLVERGNLKADSVETEIRIYRTIDILNLVEHKMGVSPIRTILCESKEGPVVTKPRWLPNSEGIGFLARSPQGRMQLLVSMLNDRKRRTMALTPESEDVTGYDVVSPNRYVYATRSLPSEQSGGDEDAEVWTGRSLEDYLFPLRKEPGFYAQFYDRSDVWYVRYKHKKRITYGNARTTLKILTSGLRALTLSPNGEQLIAKIPVEEVPKSWSTMYESDFQTEPYKFPSGKQVIGDVMGSNYVNSYFTVGLRDGSLSQIINAPTADSGGWVSNRARPSWSPDGKRLILPDVYIDDAPNGLSVPCVAVIDISDGRKSCVEHLTRKYAPGGPSPDFHYILNIRFGSTSNVVLVNSTETSGYISPLGELGEKTVVYEDDGQRWVAKGVESPNIVGGAISLRVDKGLNRPPRLVASDTVTNLSHVVWNPNSSLAQVRITQVQSISWIDDTGRKWSGGLFKPDDFREGRTYPLVIQTHGFVDTEFLPSGIMPTAYAARALAAVGFVVVQVDDNCRVTPGEARCQVDGYKALVNDLAKKRMVDPEKVGIIGFSRTVWYVLQALTGSDIKLEAASITDGVNMGYFQYLTNIDFAQNHLALEYDQDIGARPFGQGLQRWISESPMFNIDKIHAPLMIVALGDYSFLFNWEPYAELRYLHKPVDLIRINTNQHVLTNPRMRLISQQGSVDWFRFWLQNYERPNPEDPDQYKRWEHLRQLRDADQKAAQVPSPP